MTNTNESTSAVGWYKSLTMQQRFALKDLSASICGISWQDFSLLFSPRERIEILHQKLLLEGFVV